MPDATIKLGDVVWDLGGDGLMQVVGVAAKSVDEYRYQENIDLESYKSHPLLGVEDDDTVFTCVYLSSSPTAKFSGTYDFPESRLARQPVEEANQTLSRVQHTQAVKILAAMLGRAMDADTQADEEAIERCWPAGYDGVLEEARELTKSRRFGTGDDSNE